jgi:uncharacterized protein
VRKWPTREAVLQDARTLADEWLRRPGTLTVACFGSAARGDWGFGSDLDLLVIVAHASRRFVDRPLDWRTSDLPVPADVLVYDANEWATLIRGQSHFARTLDREALWLAGSPPGLPVD